MTSKEIVRKLANAVRCCAGRKTSGGSWYRPPDKAAHARVVKWAQIALEKELLDQEGFDKITTVICKKET